MSSSFIPAGSLVLVTGINSFVGAQVARELLECGFHVRGTVRSDDKGRQYLHTVPAQHRQAVSIAVVPDLTSAEGWDAAVQGVVAVVHVASPFHLKPTDNERDLLQPAVHGTSNVLDAVKQSPQVRRVVILSSFAAVLDLSKGMRVGYAYTEKDWNPVTWEEAVTSDNGALVYCASKTVAEKAAWDTARTQSTFDVVAINPPMVFGPSAFPPHSAAELGTSLAAFWDAVSGEKDIPETGFPAYVDVRDVALACRRALEVKAAGGHRFLTSAGSFTYDQVAAVVKAAIPDAPTRTPTRAKQVESYTIDASQSENLLHLTYRTAQETFVDTAKQLLDTYHKEQKNGH